MKKIHSWSIVDYPLEFIRTTYCQILLKSYPILYPQRRSIGSYVFFIIKYTKKNEKVIYNFSLVKNYLLKN